MDFSPGDFHRSTKGASKQRRDLINMEIDNLKELLPLPESVRQRLFQLQVMSMVCIFIRKDRYLPHVLGGPAEAPPPLHHPHQVLHHQRLLRLCDPCKALRGFLLMVTRQGKLLHISDNATDYLGHSVEEMMSQGDSMYDLVDSRDHATVQSELLAGPPSISLQQTFPKDKVFICRMNLSRTAKRQLQYHKFVLVHGRYLHPAEYYQALMSLTGPGLLVQPVLAAFCTPLITPENAEAIASGNTAVFSSAHHINMNIVHIDEIGIVHLGYSKKELIGMSWYRLVHPHDLPQVSIKHKLLVEDKETSCILLVRLQSGSGEWLWLHTVLALREGLCNRDSQMDQIIMATYQMLSDMEAAVLQANSWIYALPQRYADPGAAFAPGQLPPQVPIISAPPALPSSPSEARSAKRKYQRSSSAGRPEVKEEPVEEAPGRRNVRHSCIDDFNLFHLANHPAFADSLGLTPTNTSNGSECSNSADNFQSIRVEIPPGLAALQQPMLTTLPYEEVRKAGVPAVATLLTPDNSPAAHRVPTPTRRRRAGETLPVIETQSLEAYLRHVESEEPLTGKDPLLSAGLASPPALSREQLLATAFPSSALAAPKPFALLEPPSELETETRFPLAPQRRLSVPWPAAH